MKKNNPQIDANRLYLITKLNPMNTFTQEPLFKCYEKISQTNEIKVMDKTIRLHYGQFVNNLHHYLDRSTSLINSLRVLNIMKIEFQHFGKNIKTNIPDARPTILEYNEKVLKIIDSEIEILHLRINNPSINNFPQIGDLSDKPMLYWSKKKGKTQLMELILSLYADQAICYSDGVPATFPEIVSHIERSFNIELKNYSVLKYTTLNRKIKATSYLENLKRKLIELGQR